MRAHLTWRHGVLLAVLALTCLAGWAGHRALQVRDALSRTADAAAALQTALQSGDHAAERRAAEDLRDQSAIANRATSGPTWSVLGHLPVVGDDARGVRTVASVMAELSSQGVPPLLESAGDLHSVVPAAGKVPVGTVRRLQTPVHQAAGVFASAERTLAAQDSSGYVAALELPYRQLSARVGQAAGLLDSVDRAVAVLPDMLGGHGARHYLLVVQNNAEIRATGGLPGAVSMIEARGGTVRLAGQVAGSAFGETRDPVLPLTPAELAIYDRQLGTYFLDANFTPDFPRTAALMRARWEQVYPGRVDGVLSVDPVALSYLLGATGPVQVGGTTLTADNAVDQLLHQVYLRYPDPGAQDLYFRRVARAIFARVAAGVSSPEDLIRALARGTVEHRIYVHSFLPRVQAHLDGSTVTGALPVGDSDRPQVGIYLNDGTGAKMSYYLRYRAQVEATYCQSGTQGLSGHVTLRSTAPLDAATLPDYVTGAGYFGTVAGSQIVSVDLYGPTGGRITQVAVRSKPVEDPTVVLLHDRPVTTVTVELPPQGSVDLQWRMLAGADQSGDVDVAVTPSVEPRASSFTAGSACT